MPASIFCSKNWCWPRLQFAAFITIILFCSYQCINTSLHFLLNHYTLLHYEVCVTNWGFLFIAPLFCGYTDIKEGQPYFTTIFGLADSWLQGDGKTQGWIWFLIQAGHSGRQDAEKLILPTGNIFQTPAPCGCFIAKVPVSSTDHHICNLQRDISTAPALLAAF